MTETPVILYAVFHVKRRVDRSRYALARYSTTGAESVIEYARCAVEIGGPTGSRYALARYSTTGDESVIE